MSVELTIAGLSCATLAAGHWFVGRWVLPGLRPSACRGRHSVRRR
jgi:hypothetical protein